MNYTPLPSSLFAKPPTSHSPYKKALATILIAMFLGIGTTYAYFRNAASKETSTQPSPIVTVIPSPLPTVEPLEDLPSDESDAPETILTCPTGSIQVCESGVCSCSPSVETSPTVNPNEPSITQDPNFFSCSTGTVKVCQDGDCECLQGNQ